MTNFDIIKSMTVDEMAEFIDSKYSCNKCIYLNDITKKNCYEDGCKEGIKQWLLKECEE